MLCTEQVQDQAQTATIKLVGIEDIDNASVAWAPTYGSQYLFMACPYFEALFDGTRGPGKTDALLMDFSQFVGRGFGPQWKGILFRRSYKQLDDVVSKSTWWFHQIFPEAQFNKGDYVWTFPAGERLYLRYFDSPDVYWNYHGHGYPWIGWEELTSWPTSQGFLDMMSCCRSSHPGMPRRYRATANPYGVGHNWVKTRFVDAGPPCVPIEDEEGRLRVRIPGVIWENTFLVENDREYIKTLYSVEDKAKRSAWLYGDWDITAGGMFDDLFLGVHRNRIVLPWFRVPSTWKITRSLDWGSAKPFSVGWWAEANGEPAKVNGRSIHFPRGSLIRVAEWYGWDGRANVGCRMLARDVAKGIKERERMMAYHVRPGPADNQIWTVDGRQSVASEMAREGVRWIKARKNAEYDEKRGRKAGWEIMRRMFTNAIAQPREEPGLFVMETCTHFLRTVPTLIRDEHDMDDVDTNAEDHIADEVRYRCTVRKHTYKSRKVRG